MRTVNEKRAIEYIDKDRLVLVYWAVNNCPNCIHFNDILKELEKELTDWTFLKISLDSIVEFCSFSPQIKQLIFSIIIDFSSIIMKT